MSDLESATVLLRDLPSNGAMRVMISGEPVALVRSDDGVFAIRDVCSHADVALSEGDVEGCFIECWLHGSRFDLRTGEPATLPAIRAVPIYPVRVEGAGDDAIVHIDMPTPAA